jgi:hypothetical protein
MAIEKVSAEIDPSEYEPITKYPLLVILCVILSPLLTTGYAMFWLFAMMPRKLALLLAASGVRLMVKRDTFPCDAPVDAHHHTGNYSHGDDACHFDAGHGGGFW